MSQTLFSWWGNPLVRRAALHEVLPLEEQPEPIDLDHPSAFPMLTGGIHRRSTRPLPSIPDRWDDATYANGVNDVEERMIAWIDAGGSARDQDDEDEEYMVVWKPQAEDYQLERPSIAAPTPACRPLHIENRHRNEATSNKPRRASHHTNPNPTIVATAHPNTSAPTKLAPVPPPATTTPPIDWDDVVL
jgi:hypothetical protein